MSGAGSVDAFARALVRFNGHVLGATLALLAGAALFTATLAVVLRGGEGSGEILGQLRYFFPGYAISPAGAFVGALWAAAGGYVLGMVFSRIYSPWILRQAKHAASDADDAPGSSVMLLPPLPMALTTAGMLALGLFAATNWLSLRYGHPSPHLGLLANYLPGYRTDFVGSLFGSFWLFVYAFAAAGATALIYNRVVRLRLRRRD